MEERTPSCDVGRIVCLWAGEVKRNRIMLLTYFASRRVSGTTPNKHTDAPAPMNNPQSA